MTLPGLEIFEQKPFACQTLQMEVVSVWSDPGHVGGSGHCSTTQIYETKHRNEWADFYTEQYRRRFGKNLADRCFQHCLLWCYDSTRPKYVLTICVHSDVAQIRVVSAGSHLPPWCAAVWASARSRSSTWCPQSGTSSPWSPVARQS